MLADNSQGVRRDCANMSAENVFAAIARLCVQDEGAHFRACSGALFGFPWVAVWSDATSPTVRRRIGLIKRTAAAGPLEGAQRRPSHVAARLVHCQTNSAIPASCIATIFSTEAFCRHMAFTTTPTARPSLNLPPATRYHWH
jgi:hypothetical protein